MEKEYTIKIPVYTSKSYSEEAGMFDGQSYSDMIDTIESRIKLYNDNKAYIQIDSRSKSTKTIISNIVYSREQLFEKDCLLLRIEAYNTNFNDGFIRSDNEKLLTPKDEIGSRNNCVLIFPMQVGYQVKEIKKYFLVLIYGDPNKSFGQLVKVAKHVTKDVLKIPIKNIKLPDLLKELKERKVIEELHITLNTLDQSDEVDAFYKEYVISSEVKKNEETKLVDVPFGVVEKIINEGFFVKGYKRVVKFITGKKEYKIKEEYNELKNQIDKVLEKVLNFKTTITKQELDEKLFETEFILGKMKSVLENYITSYATK